MAKIRIYELARELGTDNKRLESVVRGLGIEIKNYMSTLTPEQAETVRAEFGGASPSPAATAKPSGSAAPPKRRAKVIRRKAAGPRPSEKVEAEDEQPPASPPARAFAPETRAASSEGAPRSGVSSNAPQRRPVGNAPSSAGGGQQAPSRSPGIESRRPVAPAPGIQARPSAVPAGRPAVASGATSEVVASQPAAAPARVAEAPVRRPQVQTSSQEERRSVGESLAASRTTATQVTDVAAPPVSRGGAPVSEAPSAPIEDEVGEDREKAPQVGDRIALPKGTRRFRGGLAERLDQKPARPAAKTAAQSGADSRGASSAAPRPEAASGPAVGGAEAATPNADEPTDAKGDSRRVVRNADGVIVGAAKAKSEPNIVGFIALEPRPRRQQVIITEASKSKTEGRASARKKREEKVQQQGRRRKMAVRNRRGEKGERRGSSTVEMSEAKKRIRVDEAIQISDLAHQMQVKASKVLRALWGMGMRGITINNAIDVEMAELVAAEFGYTVENVSFKEEEFVAAESKEGEPRAPIVTVMGHVDHGKTTLLDTIRKTKVAGGEAGGITQHVAAYRVETKQGPVVFVDTPGHEAFKSMRSRGAQITDIVVLIVAADDGVMPTTLEAISHAREADVPIIVAINKVDKPEANVGRVKQMLMKEGLVGEEFGGDTTICEVSALTGNGLDNLLEVLALQSELLDLRAPAEGRATGTVIESRIDKGRGAVSTVIVQSGTIKKGDLVVASEASGKVRSIMSTTGKVLKGEVGPSVPIDLLGLDGTPAGGDRFTVVESEKAAKQLLAHRREQRRRKESVRSGPSVLERLKSKKVPTLKLVLRADVQGSAEALREALEGLSTEKVRVEVISSGVGAINETDVKLAHAGEAQIIGFNVKPVGKAANLADSEKVEIHVFSVIYDATEKTKELMVDMLEPEYRERDQGEAEVRQLFPIPKLGMVCGCRVIKGRVTRQSHVRVRRDGNIMFKGEIGSLRVFKDDVREVTEGYECGIVVANFGDVQPGDLLEAFELETIRPTL